MGRMQTIAIIVALLDILFLFGGYGTMTGSLLDKVGLITINPDNTFTQGDFKSSEFGGLLKLIAELSSGAVLIGILLFSKPMDAIMLTQVLVFGGIFGLMVADLVTIAGFVSSSVGWFVSIIIFGPLLIAFVIGAVEWLRGIGT